MFLKENFFQKKEAESEIKLKEIKALEKPANNILIELKENIDNSLYTSVLGDDSSGRIPTLVLGRTINNIYEERKKNKIPVFFVAAGGSGSKANFSEYPTDYLKEVQKKYRGRLTAVKEYLGKIKEELGERVLVVTDFIDSGETIINLARILEKQNIKFDIASISVTANFNKSELPPNSNLFIGGKHRWFSSLFPVLFQPKIYGKSHLSGLQRTINLTEKDVWAKPRHLSKSEREKFNQAREDSYLLADKLAENYLRQDDKPKTQKQYNFLIDK